MLRFFRQLRRRMLPESRFGKYFLYAIGEIMLVVIGILIALQVNNWNDQRRDRLKSMEFHQRMIDDLDLIIKTSSRDVDRASEVTRSLSRSVEILEGKTGNDSTLEILDYALNNYYQMVRLNTELSSYEEMKSSGQIALITSTEVRNKISGYVTYHNAIGKIFDQLATKVNESNILNRYITTRVANDLQDNTISYTFEDLAGDRELINTLSSFALQWQTKMFFSRTLVEEATKLKDLIQKNLDNLK